jgi:hypothetical protein
MAANYVEISVRGKWIEVPALNISGRHAVVTGKWIKTASIVDDDWAEGEVENPGSHVDMLRAHARNGFGADIFTFAQRLPDATPRYAYPFEWDNVAAVRLDDPNDWWEKRLPQETRKNVRRSAKRGVIIRTTTLNDELIKGIVAINNESPVRQGKPFPHYGKDAEAVRKDYSSFLDRSEFICAYLHDELIGFIQLIYMGKVAGILELLSKISNYDQRPANALIAKAVEHCAKKGISYLTYGKYCYGNKRENPLTAFKRRNGFEEILVPRFYVPLTALGRICIAFKLHRGLLGILPERVIYPLLSLRRIWYRLAFARKPV